MFPVGHDDQIDALGHVGRLLDQMAVGTVPMPAETTHVDDYDFGDRDDSDSWKTA